MHLSNAAVLLLGALQPALGRRTFDSIGDLNEIESQWVSTNETIINYYAPDHGCGGYKAWVGVWPANACDYYGEFKTWAYVESTKKRLGEEFNTVKLSNDEIGAGKFKAAFVCEDGRREPWLVSQPFTIDKAPEAAPGQCVHRVARRNPEWTTRQCNDLESICNCVGKPTEGLNLSFDRAKVTPVRGTVTPRPAPPSSPPSSTTAAGGGGGSLVQVIRAKEKGGLVGGPVRR
ncbi:hypothetical protein BBO_07787 [Beauveria brongniartii RCEF 3172]|uniref:Uncharacterized protein n=1 Tax=Beauveria brongniartii RCEF 3172 TaxID=1081107 RepID=A0A166YN43_9HYPO|nr:hypothetical protein BBO_07787 [Beauveria brongniartii RCEF 3172]